MTAPGIRVTVRVRPGASQQAVGGAYGDGELVVAVTARPVDDAANRAVVEAMCEAFDVRRRAVRVVAGQRGRTKIVSVDGEPAILQGRLAELLSR